MAFWSEKQAGKPEPKRNFRWQVEFTGMAVGTNESILWWAKKCAKPNFTVTEAKHSFLNHTFYFPGRVEWQKIEMTLVDPVKPGAAANLAKIIQASGYVVPGNANPDEGHFQTMDKGTAGTQLGDVVITQFAADGKTALETWKLVNPFITSAKFGELDYENDDLTEVTLELRYDYGVLTTNDTVTEATNFDIHSP